MNPLLGVFFHWLGGLASASFYIPYRGVRGWAWETYWLIGGVFSWLIAPLALAFWLVPAPLETIAQAPARALTWAFIFGMLWGVGGLTFGLTMRYLGIGLGMAVALGFCSVFGTLMPPLFEGNLGAVLGTLSGQVVILGVFLCVLGIIAVGMAGILKTRELPEEKKREAVREFNVRKGLAVAVFSGVMSSCMAYALAAGKPIATLTQTALERSGGSVLWQNLPVLVVVLWGGFVTNFLWCAILNLRNKTGQQYLSLPRTSVGNRPSFFLYARNYLLCALAGFTWYLQFFFYGMGETQMGRFGFSSWTLHMSSIIIFSSLWGVIFREWKGTGKRTQQWLALGVLALVGATLVVGYGNFLGGATPPAMPE